MKLVTYSSSSGFGPENGEKGIAKFNKEEIVRGKEGILIESFQLKNWGGDQKPAGPPR